MTWRVDLSSDEADLAKRTLLWVAQQADAALKGNSQREISDFTLAHTRDRLRSLAQKFDFGVKP